MRANSRPVSAVPVVVSPGAKQRFVGPFPGQVEHHRGQIWPGRIDFHESPRGLAGRPIFDVAGSYPTSGGNAAT